MATIAEPWAAAVSCFAPATQRSDSGDSAFSIGSAFLIRALLRASTARELVGGVAMCCAATYVPDFIQPGERAAWRG